MKDFVEKFQMAKKSFTCHVKQQELGKENNLR